MMASVEQRHAAQQQAQDDSSGAHSLRSVFSPSISISINIDTTAASLSPSVSVSPSPSPVVVPDSVPVPVSVPIPVPLIRSSSSKVMERRRNFLHVSRSPTDQLLSPCSRKLYDNCKRGLPSSSVLLSNNSYSYDSYHNNGETNSGKFSSGNSNCLNLNGSPALRFTVESTVVAQPYPGGDLEFIFGTSSGHRKAIVDALGWKYTQMSPDIDEKSIRSDDPMEMPLLIAKAKAKALVDKLLADGRSESCLIFASDQIVVFEGSVREKPESKAQAIEYLSSYSNATVSTIAAVVITHFPSNQQVSDVDKADVVWKEIPMDVVEKVVEKGKIFTSAGGFQIEDPDLNPLISEIVGCADSVIGVPIDLTVALMEELRSILYQLACVSEDREA